MKKLITVLAALTILITCSSCNPVDKTAYPWEIGEESSYNFADDNVQLTLDEETLTHSGGIFYMENHSNETIYFGQDYILQIKIGNTWNDINKYGDFTAEELSVAPNGKYKFETDWSNIYGELPGGTYRLVKDYRYESTGWSALYYVCCEFTID